MINFLDEFSKMIDLPMNEVIGNYAYFNMGGKLLYVQNYLKIISYSKERMVLKTKKDIINIEGVNLLIKELEKKNLVVSGKITNVFLS